MNVKAFEPNFIQDTTSKPRLWGIQLQPVISGYTNTGTGFSSTQNTETINSVSSNISRLQHPIVISYPSALSTSSSTFTTVATHSVFVEDVKDVFSFAGQFKMNSAGTTGGQVRILINSFPVWQLTSNITSNTTVNVSSGLIPIPSVAKIRNALWQIDIQLFGTGSVALVMSNYTITLG